VQALVLIDEIDKADPDVPNDLLEPFDRGTFTVKETGDTVNRTREQLALVLTTNGERELPQAFLRRCVTLSLQDEPDENWLVRIATRRYGAADERMRAVAREVLGWRNRARIANVRRPGTAEFLDAYQVCRDLGIATPKGPAWDQVALSTLWKQDKAPSQ
jgi:MoxR-like ATPase